MTTKMVGGKSCWDSITKLPSYVNICTHGFVVYVSRLFIELAELFTCIVHLADVVTSHVLISSSRSGCSAASSRIVTW